MKVFYFGCIGDTGHYMFRKNGSNDHQFLYDNPWGTKVDGGLTPSGAQVEGKALVHYKDGWTALSFWDRSVDTRPGSCSAFLADGTLSFVEMVTLFTESFPQIVGRFRFKISEA